VFQNMSDAMESTIRVGILNDTGQNPRGGTETEYWLRLAVDEVSASGRLPAKVEFLTVAADGLPSGTAAAVAQAYETLVERDVALIVGPAIGDNALEVAPLAERHRVPTLQWSGAERARGDYIFQLQVGSHEDESVVLARYFASLDARRLGIVHDDSSIGWRHLEYLQTEARIQGLDIAVTASIAPLAQQAGVPFATLSAAPIDGLLYLGLGVAAPAVAEAARAHGWNGPRAMNTAGLRGYVEDYAQRIDGWVYVDLHADDNRTLRHLCDRLDIAPRRRLAAAKGYDLGRLVAEALARAPEPGRRGVRRGLEAVKWLPAAEGREGTILGFGHCDRAALHGQYLVLRQWRDGRTVELRQQP
jgi:ABC-type branched-subunit amino acid transport system substrate-binding protein